MAFFVVIYTTMCAEISGHSRDPVYSSRASVQGIGHTLNHRNFGWCFGVVDSKLLPSAHGQTTQRSGLARSPPQPCPCNHGIHPCHAMHIDACASLCTRGLVRYLFKECGGSGICMLLRVLWFICMCTLEVFSRRFVGQKADRNLIPDS